MRTFIIFILALVVASRMMVIAPRATRGLLVIGVITVVIDLYVFVVLDRIVLVGPMQTRNCWKYSRIRV